MGQVYVAVDLETTGLDPQKDDIIELGAVRFRDGQVLDTFSQVVNPGRPVPVNIQQLTGITQAEVDRAPSLSEIASAFRRFIGEHPLVGHNVGFDTSFLKENDLYRFNPEIDTWELSLILLPGLPSYKLGRIAEALGIELVDAHRAFADAEATMHVFEALRRRILELPAATLEQIVTISQRSEWPLRTVFEDAARDAARAWAGRKAGPMRRTGPLFEELQPLEPVEHPQPLDVDALAALLEPNGPFAREFDHYEYRPPQVEMLRTVAEAFNQSRHLLIEAGTGTGKSIAYLIPAVAWAVQTGRRVLVSSNTINLQDQLYHKDLPDLRRLLPFDFNVAVMKGRNNYLCPRRLRNLLRRPDLNETEISVLARILVWLPQTETGDQSEITLTNGKERAVWQRVCSDSLTCSPERCGMRSAEPCFFYRARRKAEAAHVIIVNHALLLADVATENNVLPPYSYLIVDEAHHLEDATTRALSVSVDHAGFVARLRELASTGSEQAAIGLLADVVTAVRRSSCPPDKAEALVALSEELAQQIPLLDMRMYEYFDALDRFLMQHFGHKYDNTNYDLRLRITQTERVQPAWVNVEITWDNVALILKRFLASLDTLIKRLSDMGNYNIPDLEDLIADLSAVYRALAEAYDVCNSAVFEAHPEIIYWVRRSQRTGALAINSAPLSVANLIEQHLFIPKDMVVLTSATLRTNNSFDYLRQRLGAHEAEERVLDSPFDYRANALVYLPTDMPEPNHKSYQTRVEETIVALSLATEGRLMALFTSYAQLLRTAEVIRPQLEAAGYTLYVQGEGGSRQQILEAFRESERAVILGTRSFWEGVDVQGEALSALVIAKLPFAVPTDPIVAARSETFDSPFYQYQMPEAILQLRQGFGRLIRSAQDRGVCVILDRRITSKQYGRMFLDSLPDCTVLRGPLANLPQHARSWLQNKTVAEPERALFTGYENYMPEPPPPEWWE